MKHLPQLGFREFCLDRKPQRLELQKRHPKHHLHILQEEVGEVCIDNLRKWSLSLFLFHKIDLQPLC